MVSVDEQSLMRFSKLLIELGDIYELQDNMTIKNRYTDEVVSVVLGKKPIPIVLFKSGLSAGEYAYLNPYKENQGKSKEREWFFNMLESCVGVLTKKLMHTIITDCTTKKDDNYNQFPLMCRIMDKADTTMLEEIEKITPQTFVSIYYNKSTKTAEAQTELFSDELKEAFPKFRKKTWEVIGILFKEFFGTEDLSEDYVYQAKILSIPETDAKLHVIISLIKAIGPLTKDVRGCDLHENELQEHLDILGGYSELYAWVNVASATNSKYPTTSPFGQIARPQGKSFLHGVPITEPMLPYSQFSGGAYNNPYQQPQGYGNSMPHQHSPFANGVPITAAFDPFAPTNNNTFWPR